MKIGAPGKTSITEMTVMKCYLAEYVPQCYASCLEDREERIKIFSNIANHLLVEEKRFSQLLNLFKKSIIITRKRFTSINIAIINATIIII